MFILDRPGQQHIFEPPWAIHPGGYGAGIRAEQNHQKGTKFGGGDWAHPAPFTPPGRIYSPLGSLDFY